MEENKRISDLFERARTEAPKTSFDEVTKHVVAASAVGGVGILAKWAALSFKLKSIIMITTLSTLTISTLLVVNLTSKTEVSQANQNLNQNKQTLDISSENGIEKTVFYDDNNTIVHVFVDSSEALKKESNTPDSDQSTDNLPLKVQEFINQEIEGSIVVQEVEAISDDSLVVRRFDFTDKTTMEDLKVFKKAAEAAGVEISYKARIRKNILKKINLKMSIKDDSERKICTSSSVYKAKTFRFETGWMEDENGRAVRFLDVGEIKPFEARY